MKIQKFPICLIILLLGICSCYNRQSTAATANKEAPANPSTKPAIYNSRPDTCSVYIANTMNNGNGYKMEVTTKCLFDFYSMRIYNRWGSEVFQSQTYESQWNGNMNNTGTQCPEGIYIYIFKYNYSRNTDTTTVKGTITMVR